MFFGKIHVINLFKSLACGECASIVLYWKVYQSKYYIHLTILSINSKKMNRNEFIKTITYNIKCHETMIQINNSMIIILKSCKLTYRLKCKIELPSFVVNLHLTCFLRYPEWTRNIFLDHAEVLDSGLRMRNYNKDYFGNDMKYDFQALLLWIDIYETELKKTEQNNTKQESDDLLKKNSLTFHN